MVPESRSFTRERAGWGEQSLDGVNDTEPGPAELLAQGLCVPLSVITGNSLQSASMTFPESQQGDSSSC